MAEETNLRINLLTWKPKIYFCYKKFPKKIFFFLVGGEIECNGAHTTQETAKSNSQREELQMRFFDLLPST